MTKYRDVPDPEAPDTVLGAWPPSPTLRAEVTDAMWADYGRMVASRLGATDDLVATVNRASMRSTTVIAMVGYIRAFILTGTKP